MTVEMDREWYREQIKLLEQEIDRRCAGKSLANDRSLGQCLAEMDLYTKAVVELETGVTAPRSSTSRRRFV